MTRHRKHPNHRHFSSCRFTTETQKHYLVLVFTKSVPARKPIRSNLLFCCLRMYTLNGAYGTLYMTRFLVSFLNSCIHHTNCKYCNICNMYFTPEVIKLKTVKRKGGAWTHNFAFCAVNFTEFAYIASWPIRVLLMLVTRLVSHKYKSPSFMYLFLC